MQICEKGLDTIHPCGLTKSEEKEAIRQGVVLALKGMLAGALTTMLVLCFYGFLHE